jgi:hypothetical protein
MSAQLAPVDRVDRIVPRVQDRSEQRRREAPPHAPKSERDESKPAPPPERKRDDDDDDHTIDLLVRGRWLPTGQILPGCDGAAPVS